MGFSENEIRDSVAHNPVDIGDAIDIIHNNGRVVEASSPAVLPNGGQAIIGDDELKRMLSLHHADDAPASKASANLKTAAAQIN